jgi:hypothetical protein
MRNRNIQLNIRLTPTEYDKVKHNCRKANLPISGYIRMLIGGYVPKETPPIEYEKLISRLNTVYSELRNLNRSEEAIELRALLLQLQAELTLPEKISM